MIDYQASLSEAGPTSSVHEGTRSTSEVNPPHKKGIRDLLSQWGSQAMTLRSFGATTQAAAIERCALQLEQALAAEDGELLTLQQAALLSGYSADHLGRLVRQGSVRNMGRPRAPRLRRGDLPRKAAALPIHAFEPHFLGADPRQVARAVVASRKGER
jgi:hypothetical protein